MFLLGSLAFGVILALLLGGRPARLLDLRFRASWLVLMALALQVVLFSSLGAGIRGDARPSLHVLSYVLLLGFGWSNRRVRPVVVVLLGAVLNGVAIAANGGAMPVSGAAARAAGIEIGPGSNLSMHATRLHLLGDVFALPHGLPFTNVFSVGDVLIAIGAVALVLSVSLSRGTEPLFSPARMRGPLAEPGFRWLLGGRLVSQLGDWLTAAALIGWFYSKTGSTAQVALLLLARFVPPILGSGVAVAVVDRFSKRRMLVSVELARAAMLIGALCAVATGQRWLVFVAVAASGGLAAISSAGVPTLVPVLVARAQYEAANAALGLAENVAMALGAASAGLALASVGVLPALAVDITTFLFAAALFACLPATAGARSRRRSASIRAGLRYLAGCHSVLVLVLAFAAATAATGLANATLPRYLGAGFGLGASGYGFGFAALAVGLALGEGAMGFVSIADPRRWIAGGLAAMAALFCLLALVDHAPTALLLLAAIGFVDGTTDIVFDTAVQREADPRFHGAVFGVASASFRMTMTVSVVAAPLANSLLPAGKVLLFTAFMLVLAAAIACAGGGRNARAEAGVPARA